MNNPITTEKLEALEKWLKDELVSRKVSKIAVKAECRPVNFYNVAQLNVFIDGEYLVDYLPTNVLGITQPLMQSYSDSMGRPECVSLVIIVSADEKTSITVSQEALTSFPSEITIQNRKPDSTPYGHELAEKVWDKLELGFSILFESEGYQREHLQKLSLINLKGQVQYAVLCMAYLVRTKTVFTTKEEFVAWLSVQSNRTMAEEAKSNDVYWAFMKADLEKLLAATEKVAPRAPEQTSGPKDMSRLN